MVLPYLPACLPERCLCPLLAPPSACAHWALHGHCLLPPLPVPTGLYMATACSPLCLCPLGSTLGSTWPLLPPLPACARWALHGHCSHLCRRRVACVQQAACVAPCIWLHAYVFMCGPLYMAACIYTMRHALRSEWPFIIIIIIWLHTCACVWLQAPCLIVLCSSWSLICLPSS